MTDFWEPFQFEFFRHGVLVAALTGGLCGLVGTYVVLRGMSYIGHGLSHAIFGGAAASAVLGVSYFLGAGLWGIASALSVGRVTRRRVVGGDAAIGVVTTAGFAVGLVLFARYGQARTSVDALLFGSILGVDEADVAVVTGVTVLAALVVFLAYRPLLFTTFDPEVAEASGVPTARLEALTMLVLSTSILVSMQVIGVTLVAANLVIPPSIARLLTHRFSRMLWLSTVLGTVTGTVGMVASYHLDIPSGATITLLAAALFVLAYAWTGTRAYVSRTTSAASLSSRSPR